MSITFTTLRGASVEVYETSTGVYARLNGDAVATIIGQTEQDGAIAIDARTYHHRGQVVITGPAESIAAAIALHADHQARRAALHASDMAYYERLERINKAMEG